MSRTILSLLIPLVFISCKQKNDQVKTVEPNASTYNIDTSTIAIFPFEKKYHYLLENATATILTNEELELAENIFQQCVRENQSNEEKQPLRDLKVYKRQYIPFIDLVGNRKIWVNCLCHDDYYWKTEIFKVADGGSCYFNVIINLSTKNYSDLQINSAG